MSSRMTILGAPIDALTKRQIIERLSALLASPGQSQVCTPNPEMLVAASRHPELLSVLRRSTLNTPDGIGLLLAARVCGASLPERVTGTDLVPAIAELSGAKLFLLGAAPGVADRAASKLRVFVPNTQVVGTFSGSPAEEESKGIIDRINASGANVLFVAFGVPTQELWIDRYLSSFSSVRIAIGVGGAFDFLAGKQKRAPALLRAIGLEWAWRLCMQPSRLPRIFTAIVHFPLLVLRYRSASPIRRADDLFRTR
ncbi:MAG: WecB/TagA/CpsF family glycosyltransferase [Candidatus Peribacteraceae bacterium]